jgi:signal transduction histidine kinase
MWWRRGLSLRARLLLLFLLSLLAVGVVAGLLVALYHQSQAFRVASTEAVLVRAADALATGVSLEAPALARLPAAEQRARLEALTASALRNAEGVEGGVWRKEEGVVAYAFPTYEGSGLKTDVPAAELSSIQAVNEEALAGGRGAWRRVVRPHETILLYARPLGPARPGEAGWVMARVRVDPALLSLRLAFSGLFLIALLLALWLGGLAYRWGRALGSIERTLGTAGETLPRLAPTGERDLDRLITAFNDAVGRLEAAQRRAAALRREAEQKERFAALGRLAAGIAHEIRNPLGAIRLKAENALAAGGERQALALRFILDQVARLDHLIRDVLRMGERRAALVLVELAPFLDGIAATQAERAGAAGVRLSFETDLSRAVFDPSLTQGLLEALIENAIRHSPRGGRVTLHVTRRKDVLLFRVADEGEGVAAPLRERLFEPFVSGRAEGTGLGLAIAREYAAAQDGRIRLVAAEEEGREGKGAVFEVELPWRES